VHGFAMICNPVTQFYAYFIKWRMSSANWTLWPHIHQSYFSQSCVSCCCCCTSCWPIRMLVSCYWLQRYVGYNYII